MKTASHLAAAGAVVVSSLGGRRKHAKGKGQQDGRGGGGTEFEQSSAQESRVTGHGVVSWFGA
jgi:hypothetical protein